MNKIFATIFSLAKSFEVLHVLRKYII